MSSSNIFKKLAIRYPSLIILTVILGFSGGIFNGVGTTISVPIILSFLGQKVELTGAPPIIQHLMSPFEGMGQNYRLLAMIVTIVLAIVLKNLANYASSVVSGLLKKKVMIDLREAAVGMLLEVDLDFHNNLGVGDIINRLGGEIGRSAGVIGMGINLVITAITILVFVGLLLAISWQLTLASTVLLAVVAFINQYSINRAKYFGKVLSETSRNYSMRVVETLSGIRLVKAVANEDREYKHIVQLIRDREQADFKSELNSAAIGPLSEVTGFISLIAIIILGRIFFVNQLHSISTVLLTYLLVLFRLLPQITQLNNLRSQFANITSSLEITNELLRRDNKPFMGNGSVRYQQLESGIHFHQVSFAYPGKTDLVLKEVDLYLPRGTTLALVGASGAGKSTLADLLPRFYDPTTGRISIDKIDLRKFDLKSIRSAMGIVSQDTFLFNDTVRNNIIYAKPDATEEEIMAVAKRSNAYEFIVRLPEKFDTMIGDRGVLLSGGQRQRLAIARALLQDPDILILDEATSALDTVSERLVQGAIEELSRERTTLVIAHRLSTVQKADRIAVMEQGRVVELGTHDELLSKGSYYARLYKMQFSEQPHTNRDEEIRKNLSYEVRTRLNGMIGSLRLLADDMVDGSEEQNELLEQSYSSAISLLNTIEFFETSAKLP